ncbi:MAG: VWA domain-containing protein [Pyrinomonadaceae bacterium]
MRSRKPILSLLLLPFASIIFIALLLSFDNSATSQAPDKSTNLNRAMNQNQESATATPPASVADVVKVDIDLVKVDALVLEKKTAKAVGGLKREDFLIYEDGAKQEITHFSKDSLPLSVLILIDRGGCLDPFRDELHRAAREAIDRLKPVDEVALMTFQIQSTLVQRFTTNRIMLENSLHNIPVHQAVAPHCLNNVLSDAANYMVKASNPAGRRVIIVISAITRMYNCYEGPTIRSTTNDVYESGAVVCGIIPKVSMQRIENGLMTMATRLTKVGGMDYMDVHTLANETGGEVLSDKLENLDTTFQTLIDHLRSRYNMGFVSTNKKRDGTTRKLKLDLATPIQKSRGKLVLKARRSYIAPRN